MPGISAACPAHEVDGSGGGVLGIGANGSGQALHEVVVQVVSRKASLHMPEVLVASSTSARQALTEWAASSSSSEAK